MAQHSIDITFAYAQLGIKPGASFEEIQTVLTNAVAYRFATRERVDNLRRIVGFFVARRQFGDITQPHTEIKKFYHRKAMDLHPDRNKGSDATEENFKKVNTAYRLVDEIYRQAKEYYKQSEAYREEIEEDARQITKREAGRGEEIRKASPTQEAEKPQHRAVMSRKYMAASIPRNIRTSRLGHLPVQTVIGSKYTKKPNDINQIFDIIMLTEMHFMRAKAYMASPEGLGTHLQYGKFSPAYTPRDTKEVMVPAEEPDPEKFARNYFRKEFGLADSS